MPDKAGKDEKMPELPEVETIAGGLNQYLRGKEVMAVIADTPKLFPNDPALTAMHLLGSRVEAVNRLDPAAQKMHGRQRPIIGKQPWRIVDYRHYLFSPHILI